MSPYQGFQTARLVRNQRGDACWREPSCLFYIIFHPVSTSLSWSCSRCKTVSLFCFVFSICVSLSLFWALALCWKASPHTFRFLLLGGQDKVDFFSFLLPLLFCTIQVLYKHKGAEDIYLYILFIYFHFHSSKYSLHYVFLLWEPSIHQFKIRWFYFFNFRIKCFCSGSVPHPLPTLDQREGHRPFFCSQLFPSCLPLLHSESNFLQCEVQPPCLQLPHLRRPDSICGGSRLLPTAAPTPVLAWQTFPRQRIWKNSEGIKAVIAMTWAHHSKFIGIQVGSRQLQDLPHWRQLTTRHHSSDLDVGQKLDGS